MTYLLALSALFSRILGFLRNFLFASAFGAGSSSDAYFAAFQIPDTLYRLLVVGAISASFVPFFLRIRKRSEGEAWAFASTILNSFLILIGIISLFIFIFSQSITAILYPGFTEVQIQESSHVLRIMILSPLFFTFSSVLAGIQNSFRSFLGFALAPLVYNLGIMFGILVLAPTFGISGVAFGVMIGCVLHVAVQWLPVKKLGFHWSLILQVTDEFKKFFWIILPRLFTMAGLQLMFFVEGIIATTLTAGDLSVLRFAEDIQYFPVGIVGLSLAISSFSVMSDLAIQERHGDLAQYLQEKLDHLLILLIPASFGIFLLRVPLVTLTLHGGAFTKESVMLTASVLAALCLDIVATAMIPILSRVFFAFHDTLSSFLIVVSTVLINIVLAILLAPAFGVVGIGLAGAVAATIAVIMFFLFLRFKYFKNFSFFSFSHSAIFLFASLIMSLGLSFLLPLISFSDDWVLLFIQILGTALVGAFLYGSTVYLFLRKKLWVMLKEIGM